MHFQLRTRINKNTYEHDAQGHLNQKKRKENVTSSLAGRVHESRCYQLLRNVNYDEIFTVRFQLGANKNTHEQEHVRA